MADGKTGRKRKMVIEAEAPIADVPGQGELFGGIPAETVTDGMDASPLHRTGSGEFQKGVLA